MISGLGAIQQKLRSGYNTRNQQYREAEIATKNGKIKSHIMRTGVLDTCLKWVTKKKEAKRQEQVCSHLRNTHL